ncbi:peptide methionine sulfoxide reductase [Nocardioides sp.]|uniref:peptide methionine sulfoxide reductase n=1 Tax=Nocardioides sp. TaxID=35761 RepID=UPI0037833F4E
MAPGAGLSLARLLGRFPEGWSVWTYDGRRYGVTRTVRAGGRAVAVYAEELGGTDVVSANAYLTSAGEELRPCEMPAAKVLAFLERATPVS